MGRTAGGGARPDRDTSRRLARLFLLALGAFRIVEGVVALAAPGAFLRLLGHADPSSGTRMAIRMKSARDISLGAVTLLARHDDARLADLAATAVVVDGTDGLATLAEGTDLPDVVRAGGTALGLAGAGGVAWAAVVLRRG